MRWHGEADEPWLNLLAPTVSVADYLGQLVRAYGFIASFEGACKYTPNLARVFDFRHLTRAGLIAQDLLSLGLRPSQVASVPHCPTITCYRSVAEAAGWLYVVERSALLHAGIRLNLLRRLPDVENACSFLGVNDAQIGERWAAFGSMIERVGVTPALADETVAAARDAFDSWKRWFRTHSVEAVRRAG
jgi:heme oxygenase